jgi:hypothetical protein
MAIGFVYCNYKLFIICKVQGFHSKIQIIMVGYGNKEYLFALHIFLPINFAHDT